MATARRVTVIAHELRGFRPTGGMGTATTFLALALARRGHTVEILLGKHDPESIDPSWAAVYRDAGIQIRPAPRSPEPVEPWHFDYPRRIELGLRADPPEIVIAHDFGAPAYSALRLRQAGLALDDTLFVVFCHGPRRYVVDLSPTVPLGDLQTVLAVGVLERRAVELADVVVSPSAYLLEWMRRRDWQLPERRRVIPYFTASEATGMPVVQAERATPDPLRRLAFFGRVDEKKGLRVFADALNALEPERLRRLELEFVGGTTKTWTRERAEGLLSEQTRGALRGLSFETGLDQPQALARLSRPGTLVVIPSLQENSPNTVYECLEHGIPFIASNVGGVPELIAPDERARVLFEPTHEALAGKLRLALDEGNVPAPVRPAHEPSASSELWDEVLALRPVRHAEVAKDQDEFLLFPDASVHEVRETLLPLQRATGADVVTCGIRVDGTAHFFLGESDGLAALENTLGTVGLVRRSLLDDHAEPSPPPRDPAWPLFARLASAGAHIVSLPLALVDDATPPGTIQNDPIGALLALQELERALPESLKGAARLAAGLAADTS
jgi:glycosyltransferase involved in cell wall biosynthesis